MKQQSWQPTASIKALKQRALILHKIRDFFFQREVMEVETPILSAATVTDPFIMSLSAQVFQKNFYLQTSPEYAMKRLLSAGSGPIYQIGKAFRDDEQGAMHNPEFTMLEWYRPGFDHHDLMNEMNDLLQCILACDPAEYLSYQAAFQQYLSVDPHSASLTDLSQLAKRTGISEVIGIATPDRDLYLQWLMTEIIEPKLGQQRPCFIYDYPKTQAALAKIRQGNPPVAERFEVYYKGIELANGFHELADSQEQRARFQHDLQKRQANGTSLVPIDENLLAALEAGFPNCSGVALGIDRLVMLALEKTHIADVISFDFCRA